MKIDYVRRGKSILKTLSRLGSNGQFSIPQSAVAAKICIVLAMYTECDDELSPRQQKELAETCRDGSRLIRKII